MLCIHERDFAPSHASVAGHWQSDLIAVAQHRSAIGTIVERQTRYVKLLHLPALTSAGLHAVLVPTLREPQAPLRRPAKNQGAASASF
jgi:IS30 family transposase